jgi:hypothetical protein
MRSQRSLRRFVLLAGWFAVLSFSLPEHAAAQAAPPSPITFTSGSMVFTLGGYFKLDAIHDFNANSNPDAFSPRNIPVDGSEGTNTTIYAKQTRLTFGMEGPVEGRQLKLFVEGDFYSSGNAFRLRHAYGKYGVLLAGQTWTTVFDELNIPATIDYEAPVAAPFIRQGMVRITTSPSKNSELGFAVEESDPEVVNPTGLAGGIEKTVPDLTARYRVKFNRGHVMLSGFVGQTRFRTDAGATNDVTIGGVLLSTRLRLFTSDAAYFQAAYGPGIGRYRGGPSAEVDADGNLQTLDVLGFTAGYERHWSERWESNFVVSPAWLQNDVGDPGTTNKELTYAAANLKYWFLAKRAWAGAEYLYGRREVRSGADGTGNRLQLAVTWLLLK